MLLNFLQLVSKHNIKAKGAIHVGSHYAQEYFDYVTAGIEKFVFIEPCLETFSILKERRGNDENVILVNCACGEVEEERVMYTGSSNQGQSNSLLKMEKHLQIHPGITLPTTEMVSVRRLDNLGFLGKGYDFLCMDCQGFEGFVLKGAPEILKEVNYVYTEANRDEVYSGCTKVDELDSILNEFERTETGDWVGGMWTDCLYIRKTLLK